jgi:NAD-dependent deacetylase
MKILVLTGAGISQPSGIQTYRGANGRWGEFDVSEVATSEAFERQPDVVNQFFQQRWLEMKDCEPNAAHIAIAELEAAHDVLIVTQNIDMLHEKAGSADVIHFHGQIDRVDQPLSYEGYRYREEGMDLEGTRPDVVLFGDPIERLEYTLERIEGLDPDEVWIVGTTMVVEPFASLADFAQKVAKKARTDIAFHIFDMEPKSVQYNAGVTAYSPRETLELHAGSADVTIPRYVKERW